MSENKKQTKEAKYYDHPLNSRLRELVNKKNIAAFAEALGVTQDAVRQWQAGYTRPDVDRLGKIAEHFGVTSDYLLGLSTDNIPDLDVRAIVEKTRLTKAAVSKIMSGRTIEQVKAVYLGEYEKISDKGTGYAVSALIENDHFWSAVDHLAAALFFEELAKRLGDKPLIEQGPLLDFDMGADKFANIYWQMAKDKLSLLVEEMRHAEA